MDNSTATNTAGANDQKLTQQVDFSQYASIGKFAIVRTIGDGMTCKAKLGINKETGQEVAVKIFKPDIKKELLKDIEKEIFTLKMLDHVNILKYVDSGSDDYVGKSGKVKQNTFYVVTEILHTNVFEFISETGKFTEPMARYYFQQMITGVKYCHDKGIAHRDLKPENMMLDDQMNLKIIDFGFANTTSRYLNTELGTPGYMAPEIRVEGTSYKGEEADLFALAVILFMMITCTPPFQKASPNDKFYKALLVKPELFWNAFERNQPKGYSAEFKDLMQKMLALEPSKRLTMDQLIQHPWVTGPIPQPEEIIAEFQQRTQAAQEAMKNELEQIQQKKEMKKLLAKSRGNTYMSGAGEDLLEAQPTKQLDMFGKSGISSMHFFTTYNPDLIEQEFLTYLQKQEIEPTSVNENKYKIGFEMESQRVEPDWIDDNDVDIDGGMSEELGQYLKQVDTEDTNESMVGMSMRIMEVQGQGIYCVEFQKTSGEYTDFTATYNFIRNDVLGFANDAVL